MPPPIEEEEDVIPPTQSTPYLLDWAHLADHTRQEIEHHEASDSDSDEVIELDETPLESEMFHVGDHTQQTPRLGPEFEPEPMLVVSDVVAKKAVPARTALPVLKPSKPETRTADKRRKRGVDVSFDTGVSSRNGWTAANQQTNKPAKLWRARADMKLSSRK